MSPRRARSGTSMRAASSARRKSSRDPSSLPWTIYFVLLAIIANGRADAHVRTACFFALIGLVGYRLDEARQRGLSADMRRRGFIVAGALIAAAIYFRVLVGT